MGFLGNSRKPKPFGFIPRFYDEQKEERNKRLNMLNNPDDIDIAKDRIKSGLRATYRGDAAYKKQQTKRANWRLFYIIVISVSYTHLTLPTICSV